MATPGSPNPTTSYTLFDRLRQDGNRRQAMEQFVQIYTPFIISRIRRTASQLQNADIQEVSQNIHIKVWTGLIDRSFSLERRSFRKWFAVVIRNEVLLYLRPGRGKHQPKGDDGLSHFAAADRSEEEAVKDLELFELRRALEKARQKVREIEWQAFQLSVFGESNASNPSRKLSAAEVGERLKIGADRVHAFKFTVMQRLRELMSETL